jgi:hypothetical protein
MLSMIMLQMSKLVKQTYKKYTVIWTPPFKLHKISLKFIVLLQMCLQGLHMT